MKSLTNKEAFKLTGKRSEAEILRSFSFWQSKAKTKRDGRVWIIKTAEEMIAEGCLYSKPTIYRTIRSLALKGLIEVEHHPHPYRNLLKASWIIVSDKVSDLLSEIEVDSYDKPESAKEKLQSDQNSQFLYTGDLSGNLSGDHIQPAPAALLHNYFDNLKNMENRAGFSNISHGLESYIRKNIPKPQRLSPIKTNDICFELVVSLRRNHPNHVPGPIDSQSKRFAQLLLEHCRKRNLDDQEIAGLIDFAVEYWSDFVEEKKNSTGIGVTAQYANLKDLSRFVSQLISFKKNHFSSSEKSLMQNSMQATALPPLWKTQ